MSLTSQLDDRNSHIRQFMETRLPETTPVVREANKILRAAETIRPTGAVPWMVLGTAFDYRARYHLEVTPYRDLVAWAGARNVSDSPIMVEVSPEAWVGFMGVKGGPKLSKDVIEAFFESLDNVIEDLSPVGRQLDREDEDLLNRYCVVLSYFEDCARARPRPDAPLFSLGEEPTLEQLLALVQPHWLDDLSVLSARFIDNFERRLPRRMVLNPRFKGSRDVGGADADLILDRCLFELKSTVKASISKVALYQLVGYALLDYEDAHGLEQVAFYMARQGESIEWSINDLLERLSGDSEPTLAELREELRGLLQAG